MIALVVIVAAMLAILLWIERKSSKEETERLRELNKQLSVENQEKLEAVERRAEAESFYQKLKDGLAVNCLIIGDSIAENGQGENGWCTLFRANLQSKYGSEVNFTNI